MIQYPSFARRRRAILRGAFLLLLIATPLPVAADPCADEITSLALGADGGYHLPDRPLPGVVLGLPRGAGATSQSLDVLSLGDGGQITLGFLDNLIVDGPGADFRVFENAFRTGPTNIFRELGFVEASADGITFHRFPVDSATFIGLAGQTPVLTHPDNGIDPRYAAAGGDAFDLATIGLTEARFIRIVDADTIIDDEGNHFPIHGRGQSGFDLDAILAVNSAETCGACCDTVFDGHLGADDLVTLLRAAAGLNTAAICGPAPCSASHCGDTDADGDLDTNDAWLCFDRALGGTAPCAAGDCDLGQSRRKAVTRASASAFTLEIPAAGTIQSGIGIVSGWRCEAGRLTARFDCGEALELAYGTPRADTYDSCGDINNAFVMQWNYANLDDGLHTIRLYDDGVEFASAGFVVQRLGQSFLPAADIMGQWEHTLTGFPEPGAELRLRWQTAAQSFGIVGRAPRAAATAAERRAGRVRPTSAGSLEIPQPGSTMSGIGTVSGWRCEAGSITASFDGQPALPLAYGTPRADTESICGDLNNAFALQWNYALLGDGPHSLTLFDDGLAFASVNFAVATLGESFLHGASGVYDLENFPQLGDSVRIQWQEAAQSFGVVGFIPASAPTPTPAPTATPTPAACSTLRVHLEADTSGLAGVIAELDYPASVSLPWSAGESAVAARIDFGASPLPTLTGFRKSAGKLLLGFAATTSRAGSAVATIEFDCESPTPNAASFHCTLDAADATGTAAAAGCIVRIE
ncbi:MAG: hypothetical protein VCC00_14805 [Deltaproteobacteria bacterium]